MSDPNNIEGPPPTPEDRAAMARELDRVAPTPGDKFRLMLGQRPTPRTDAEILTYFSNNDGISLIHLKDHARQLERELAEALEEGEEQARLLGMSGEREAGLLGEIDRLQCEREDARRWLEQANKGAERNAEALRISSEKLNDARAWSSKLADLADDLRADLAEAREQRDRLATYIRAATVLIAAKGRHNTKLAYDGLRAALTELEGGADE